MWITFLGIQPIQTCSALQVRKIAESFSGTRDVCFALYLGPWFLKQSVYLESRHVQQLALKFAPVYTNYTPDGRSLIASSSNSQMYTFTYGKFGEDIKEQWRLSDKEPVRLVVLWPKAIFQRCLGVWHKCNLQPCWDGVDPYTFGRERL